ncbi:hypothetical protein [Seohaeicola zhoushanensis]|uniref:Uncharacterized protein n=1 Tax=Seohaeicola zhoushanensis TaxID=1569283 RepID=A0A8J3GTU6_9RHOB|nr:hypothetical protein [Seohaeicola zhoushanensis]GHF35820.1 hypothetical protein GCM10017056_04440 [Seohaeicola zhoushanensis]
MSARLVLIAALAALIAQPAAADGSNLDRLRGNIAARNAKAQPLLTHTGQMTRPAMAKGKLGRTGCANGPTPSGLGCATIAFAPSRAEFTSGQRSGLFSVLQAVPVGPHGRVGLGMDLPRLMARYQPRPKLFEKEPLQQGR